MATINMTEANRYEGTLTGVPPGSEVPFKEIQRENENVTASFEMTSPQGTRELQIKFVLRGDSLQGKADSGAGPEAMTWNFELSRVVETVSPPPGPRIGEPGSQAELEEFEQIKTETDLAVKKARIDEFLKKYPDSGMKALAYHEGAYVGIQMNKIEIISEYGERGLEEWPGNVALMTELGSAYAQRNRLDQAEQKAEGALEMVRNMQKPPEVPEGEWSQMINRLYGTNYCSLGYVYMRRAQASSDPDRKRPAAEKALIPFQKALEFQSRDIYSLYGLGLTHVMLNDYPGAESNLAKAAVLGGAIGENAHSLLEEIYRMTHGGMSGLEGVMAKARSELGIP